MMAQLLSNLIALRAPAEAVLAIDAERVPGGVRVDMEDGTRVEYTDEEVDRIAAAKAKGTK